MMMMMMVTIGQLIALPAHENLRRWLADGDIIANTLG
jgi:hypothetical protein